MIQVDNEFIVVGGYRAGGVNNYNSIDQPTETCKLNEQLMKCVNREPKLTAFKYYPELLLIKA